MHQNITPTPRDPNIPKSPIKVSNRETRVPN